MIVATLKEEDGNWLGDWAFVTLPRIGEQIVVPADRYQVLAVEHWPALKDAIEAHDHSAVRLVVTQMPNV